MRRTAAAALFAGLSLASPGAAQEGFLLGPGDRVSVTVHRRADLSGEFRVLPGGALSLPFVGTVPAAGRGIDDLRQAITARLREEASLLDPRVSVEILEFQPVLVAGNVRRPGQVPYQLGMTAAHALAIAGGARRLELEEVGARVEVQRLRERLRQAQDAAGLALIRRARLAAEEAGGDDFAPPDAAARYLPEDRLAESLAAERAILQRRAAAFASQITMLAAQTAAFEDEIRALQEQNASKDQEAALLEQERAYVADLMRRGLTARDARVVQLARSAVQVEGERRQILAFIARARQELARIDQARAGATIQRRLEIAAGLKEAADSLAGLRVTIEEARSGLAELRETLPPEDSPAGLRAPPAMTVLRVRGAEPVRLEARPETPLMPGDLLDIPNDTPEPGRRVAAGPRR